MQYANIILETADRVATIRLNRPDALNALNLELLAEFSHAVAAVGEDESVKALVIRGCCQCWGGSRSDWAFISTPSIERGKGLAIRDISCQLTYV